MEVSRSRQEAPNTRDGGMRGRSEAGPCADSFPRPGLLLRHRAGPFSEWAGMSSSENRMSTLGKSRDEKGREVGPFMTARHEEVVNQQSLIMYLHHEHNCSKVGNCVRLHFHCETLSKEAKLSILFVKILERIVFSKLSPSFYL